LLGENEVNLAVKGFSNASRNVTKNKKIIFLFNRLGYGWTTRDSIPGREKRLSFL
jgi:hypothetical protein